MLGTISQAPHEPTVPSFDALLKPDVVLDACRRRWDRASETERWSWRAARMIEASYHPRRHLRAAYVLLSDFETDERRYWPEGQIVYFHTPARTPMSRRGDLITIDGNSVEVYRFPNDRRLRGLRVTAGKPQCARMWERWSDSRGDKLDASTLQRRMVRYVPEHKWIIRLRAKWSDDTGYVEEARRVAVRACRPTTCESLCYRHRLLSAASRGRSDFFRIPEVAGESSELGLFGVEWIRGSTLVETMREQDPCAVMNEVSRRLRAFHAIDVPDLEDVGREDLVRRVRFASRDLALAVPELKARIVDLRRRCVEALSCLDSEPSSATLHNDFHWNQLSIKKDRFALFDFDRLAIGDPLIDVANLAAQIELLSRRSDVSVNQEESRRWRSAVLESWAATSATAPDGRRLHLYGAVARWEVARGLLRHLRPGWGAFAESCLDHVESDLQLAERGDWTC